MSHISMQKSVLHDGEAIKQACVDLHLKIRENDRPVYYSGRRADVVCDFVLSLPGTNYEVGLKWNPATSTYDLYYDKYTGAVENILGKDCQKLVQTSAYHEIVGTARLRGYTVDEAITVTENRHMLFEIEQF